MYIINNERNNNTTKLELNDFTKIVVFFFGFVNFLLLAFILRKNIRKVSDFSRNGIAPRSISVVYNDNNNNNNSNSMNVYYYV